jgi:hypothetical protein
MDQILQVINLYNELWKSAGLDRAENVIAPHFMRSGVRI